MKLKYIGILVFGAALVSFTGPTALLVLIKGKNTTQVNNIKRNDNLRARRIKYEEARYSNTVEVGYLSQTKAAIIRDIKRRSAFETEPFEVSKIVFTSEKVKWVAGQKQVHLSFTYQLEYRKAKPQQLHGSILLASDADGKLFSSQVKI